MVSSDYYIVDNSDLENKRLEAAKNHYSKGDYSSALRLYLDMLNMSTSFKLYYEIGRCYYKLNDLLPAEEYFKKHRNTDFVSYVDYKMDYCIKKMNLNK